MSDEDHTHSKLYAMTDLSLSFQSNEDQLFIHFSSRQSQYLINREKKKTAFFKTNFNKASL